MFKDKPCVYQPSTLTAFASPTHLGDLAEADVGDDIDGARVLPGALVVEVRNHRQLRGAGLEQLVDKALPLLGGEGAKECN